VKQEDSDEGAAMVEMSIVLTLLVMLLVGMVQMGLAYNRKVEVTSAAREGARAASLRLASPGSYGTAAAPGVPVTMSVGSCAAGDTTSNVSATATSSFGFSIPFVFTQTVSISATGVMRCGG
jgi:Flp pilus assembly protein TadG